jgi:post-segregation antitoxin (ccd killing protein)
MKRNAQIHIFVETPVLEKLKEEAREIGIPLSELCRQKIKASPGKIERLEWAIEKLEKLLVT